MVLSTTGGGALVGTGGGLRTYLEIRSRKTNNAAPAAPSRSTNTTAARIEERGDDARRGPNCETPSAEAGRGLPTWEADRMNFVSCDVGAWGTTIFWKQETWRRRGWARVEFWWGSPPEWTWNTGASRYRCARPCAPAPCRRQARRAVPR